ncbi:MAG: nucleotidyltransferase domain-containing protein [Verrucomicrobia bacterium]|nr:nucleotidyltransferase domain-containing protein [Verrucomicrobiota bacterium]MCG2680586.1 nucleotidyltransferase domain-containing protein [Kiritimatiellia bacterium]MBU4247526.1 nucleotidyltransferase domain-containing protein [Verrucomicrobiota bacterium]MBU4290300.1 nucleotidyltransferase domain-containing protein [Verrucomicrobiota bacterium]MBU4429474.1 nucleotidyltransferase domain-containing protein [Verrucomicrobiota bacterium]
MIPTAQHLWAVTPEKIAEAMRRIVEAVHPVRVILFGSQARGNAGRDSDLDIMIVEQNVQDAAQYCVYGQPSDSRRL